MPEINGLLHQYMTYMSDVHLTVYPVEKFQHSCVSFKNVALFLNILVAVLFVKFIQHYSA